MKKFLFLFLMISSFAFAQKGPSKPDCVISGDLTIEVGSQYTYSIPGNLAQCTNCHDWDIASFTEVVEQVGDDRQNQFTIEALSTGTFTLRVTYFDEQGCHTCQITVNVIPAQVPCFEPILAGKLYCLQNPPTGTVRLDYTIMDLSNVDNITWIFNSSINPGNYNGFGFYGNNQTSIQSFNKASGFSEDFYFTSGCPTNRKICFDYIVEFEDETTCEVGYYEGTVCGFLTDDSPAPIINVSPNPATSEVTVEFSNFQNADVQLELYDIQGALILQQTVSAANLDQHLESIKLPRVSGNMVFLRVLQNNKLIETKSILVE